MVKNIFAAAAGCLLAGGIVAGAGMIHMTATAADCTKSITNEVITAEPIDAVKGQKVVNETVDCGAALMTQLTLYTLGTGGGMLAGGVGGWVAAGRREDGPRF